MLKTILALIFVCAAMFGQTITNARHVLLQDTDALYAPLGIRFDPFIRVHFQTDIVPTWPGVDIRVTFFDSTSEVCASVPFKATQGWYTAACELSPNARGKTVSQVQILVPPPPPFNSQQLASLLDATVRIDALTESSVRISYQTVVAEANNVSFGATTQYDRSAVSPSFTATKNHVWYLSGLMPQTLVNFRIDGIEKSSNFTFTTPTARNPFPEAPRSIVDTSIPVQTGTKLTVDTLCTNLSSLIIQAAPGDTIAIPAGTRCVGNFVFPAKTGTGWIVVETLNHNLPNSRVSPIVPLAQILTPKNDQTAILVPDNSHHWRFQALEIGPAAVNPLVVGGGLPADIYQCLAETSGTAHHVIFDRVRFAGLPDSKVDRGVRLNGNDTAVINSRFERLYVWDADPTRYGLEALGIVVDLGVAGKIENNFFDVPGISVFLGTSNSHNPVSDWVVRRNHFYLSPKYMWSNLNPQSDGRRYAHRQMFETKNLQRAIFEGNVFEGNFGDLVSSADAWLISTRPGSFPLNQFGVQDVLLRRNWFLRGSGGISISGHNPMDYSAASEAQVPTTARIWMEDNLFERIDAYKYTAQNSDGTPRSNRRGKILTVTDGAENITFVHNTVIDNRGEGPRWLAMFGGIPSYGLRMNDNIFYAHNDWNNGGIVFDSFRGLTALDAGWRALLGTSWEFNGNVVVDPPPNPTSLHQPINRAIYPSNIRWTTEAGVGFTDLVNSDFRLLPTSPYLGAGANIDALVTTVQGVR